MASLLFVALFVAIALHGANSRAVLEGMNAKEPIEGQYIIVLQPNISQEAREKHMSTARSLHDVDETIEIRRIYDIGSFKAYSARMNRHLLEDLRDLPEVKYVEQDQVVHALSKRVCDQVPTELWGLARVSHRSNDVKDVFNYDEQWDGQGVTAYVIDTGIYTEHVDFEGRAEPGVSFVSDEPTSEDFNGHGTHVTGTIIGLEYGIAKKATAVAVKVLSRFGSGTFEGVIDGINWVARNARKPAVSNMSLGGGFSQAVNDAVDEAVASGVMFAIAAGNGAGNACFNSPASAKDGLTVGSTDTTDQRSSFSDYGECIEIFAPGSNIKSAWIGSPTASSTISGTSMASPHVAGVIAEYLSQYPTNTPLQVYNDIREMATPNVVSNPGTGSPNRLLYRGCEE